VAEQQIDLVLPRAYGLAGVDTRWGKPEDYGHHDQKATVTTDANGQFEYAFAATTYSVTFWLIPPLGPIPRKPPEPYFYLKLPVQMEEFWVLWMRKSGVKTRVIERGNRTALVQSQVAPAEFSGKLIWEGEALPGGYLVDFEMKLVSGTSENRANKATDSDKQ
jgi:hypothetical protein